jgi:hypothetical protein
LAAPIVKKEIIKNMTGNFGFFIGLSLLFLLCSAPGDITSGTLGPAIVPDFAGKFVVFSVLNAINV